MAEKSDKFAIAASTLRDLDRRRYYATLIVPADRRHYVQALYAFVAEIEAVRFRVLEPAAGEIRLRWWLDMLERQGSGPSDGGSPILGALIETLADCKLDPAPLCRLVEAHRFDLYRDPMPDLASFEGFAGETVSVPLHLAATIVHGSPPKGSAEVAGHLGVGMALGDELARLGVNLSRGNLRLPLEVFTITGLSENELLAGIDDARTTKAVARLTGIAKDHLVSAENAIASLASMSGPARLAFAPIAILKNDLARLARHNGPVLRPPANPAGWLDIARLSLWAWRGPPRSLR